MVINNESSIVMGSPTSPFVITPPKSIVLLLIPLISSSLIAGTSASAHGAVWFARAKATGDGTTQRIQSVHRLRR